MSARADQPERDSPGYHPTTQVPPDRLVVCQACGVVYDRYRDCPGCHQPAPEPVVPWLDRILALGAVVVAVLALAVVVL